MSASSEESLKKDDNGGKSDSEGDIFVKIRSLFGDAICGHEALQREEINDIDLVKDLASRDADAPIYTKLGFSYRKAVWFKKEFGSKQKSLDSGRPSSPVPKPTMADMSTYTPEMRQLYLSK